MPRHYQRKLVRESIPKDVYMRVHWLLRGYERMKHERADILWGGHVPNDLPHGTSIANPSADKAVKLACLEKQMEPIEQSALEIRGEYSGVTPESFDPIRAYFSYSYFNGAFIRHSPADDGPSQRTWVRYKDYFSVKIAQKIKYF